jgi:hypothetical protein
MNEQKKQINLVLKDNVMIDLKSTMPKILMPLTNASKKDPNKHWPQKKI